MLLYRRRGGLEVLLAHPGGPYFRNRDLGAWTLPKGIVEEDEDLEDAARRELEEETGIHLPEGDLVELGNVRQKGGKVVYGFALEYDWDPALLCSNLFSIEWPPRSGRQSQFPEIDRAEWLGLDEAAERIVPAQSAFLVRLAEHLLTAD
jgi:predicted NUDIX family NTP pyrophosphohydrolase